MSVAPYPYPAAVERASVELRLLDRLQEHEHAEAEYFAAHRDLLAATLAHAEAEAEVERTRLALEVAPRDPDAGKETVDQRRARIADLLQRSEPWTHLQIKAVQVQRAKTDLAIAEARFKGCGRRLDAAGAFLHALQGCANASGF